MSGLVAVSCVGVSKRFPLVDGGSAWKLAFGGGKHVPVHEALRGVSLEVPKGQFVGVLGRNGAGKSTLLRVLGGVYSADEGAVSINGSLSAIYELGLVGNPQLTGRAYSERLLTVHGFSEAERKAVIDDICDFSELGSRFEDPVLTYSAGMAARLFFSTATAGSYDVYLLDEILSVGDQHFQAKCWRRLRERISKGASGVLVTHDWSAVVKMCQTAHVLEGGKFAFSGPATRAVRRYLYGDDVREAHRHGIARFATRPENLRAATGDELVLRAEVDILTPAEVGCVCVIERLQPGFGWETSLMSRGVSPVGFEPGRYGVEIAVPDLPLDAGEYQIAIHLVMPDPDLAGRRILLDGWSWLNGDGVELTVVGDPARGLALPMTWRVHDIAAAETTR